jgi:hypothetical protein
VTLRHAADYIMKIPKAEQDLEGVASRGRNPAPGRQAQRPDHDARIGMLRALNRHVQREFNSSRKDTHWGQQKLARDR